MGVYHQIRLLSGPILEGEVIHHEFSCDFRGCEVRVPSVATHAAVMPGDWGSINLIARGEDKHENQAEGHLCPEHTVLIGKLLGGTWSESMKIVKTPPKRFR